MYICYMAFAIWQLLRKQEIFDFHNKTQQIETIVTGTKWNKIFLQV